MPTSTQQQKIKVLNIGLMIYMIRLLYHSFSNVCLYNFFTQGEPLPDLPPPTALFLLQCLDILGSTMLKLDSENAEKFLFSFRSNMENAKRYGQDRREADEGKEPIAVSFFGTSCRGFAVLKSHGLSSVTEFSVVSDGG